MNPTEKNKGGRPTKRTPLNEWWLLFFLEHGLPRAKAFEGIGIQRNSFQRWMRNDPDFAEQVKQAELIGKAA